MAKDSNDIRNVNFFLQYKMLISLYQGSGAIFYQCCMTKNKKSSYTCTVFKVQTPIFAFAGFYWPVLGLNRLETRKTVKMKVIK